jgi:hypothetical protein
MRTMKEHDLRAITKSEFLVILPDTLYKSWKIN